MAVEDAQFDRDAHGMKPLHLIYELLVINIAPRMILPELCPKIGTSRCGLMNYKWTCLKGDVNGGGQARAYSAVS